MATHRQDGLYALLEPAIVAMGYELVGIEHIQSGTPVLRVYIEQAEGVSVDDCARVSHQISGILDVEDPIPGNYALEVSSPGVERPLFRSEHYERFTGERIHLQTRCPDVLSGRRKYKGVIMACEAGVVRLLLDDGEEESFPVEQIARAHLLVDLANKNKH